MPAHRGRPSQFDGKAALITFKIDESFYTDIARYAREHGLSVPLYVGMMMCTHVLGIREAEADRAREASRAR
jgi:hypothetical protein